MMNDVLFFHKLFGIVVLSGLRCAALVEQGSIVVHIIFYIIIEICFDGL